MYFGIKNSGATDLKHVNTWYALSGINLTDEQQTSQSSNSGSARNVIDMNGTDVASMAIGSWTQ